MSINLMIKLKELKELLKKEIFNLIKIKNLLELKKKSLLKTKALIDLTSYNKKIKILLNEEIIFEQNRYVLLNNIKNTLDYKNLNLSSLIKYLEKLEKNEYHEFKNIHKKFKLIITEIYFLNKTNEKIIEDHLKIMEDTFKMCSEENRLEVNYGKKNHKKNKNNSIVLDTLI